MKNVLTTLFAATVTLISTGAAAEGNSVLVQAPIEKIFVPQGFDDNDKVEVIVHGHFTSTCYKMGPVEATIDEASQKVLVTAEAYYYPGAVCVQLMTPFIKSVEIKGQMSAGNYKVEVVKSPDVKPVELSIGRSSRPDADDYLYASVNSAAFEVNATGERELVLKGQHPYLLDGCMKFDKVRTYLSPSNVMVVQPITKIVYGDECRGANALVRFEEHVKVQQPLSAGEYVMHVRVLDGNALNQFVSVD